MMPMRENDIVTDMDMDMDMDMDTSSRLQRRGSTP